MTQESIEIAIQALRYRIHKSQHSMSYSDLLELARTNVDNHIQKEIKAIEELTALQCLKSTP